ncbi:hypothetical protein [Blastococcus atacamensis]|uniref:hypothetical protein n=1 Tax=Blastococcus atacamensis TaxID=2070508 RepID=UPI000DE48CA3|nr:hypothetical protein [Blastococcus atacamensis]
MTHARNRIFGTATAGTTLLAATSALVLATAMPAAAAPGGNGGAKVTLCHATGSASNPYVQITVADDAAYNGHHSQHQDLGQGDIIPPFTYQGSTYSLNWDGAGQATFARGCTVETTGGPQKPDNPGNPGNPGKPENPGNAGNPGNPHEPENPGTPEKPANPGNPGTPSGPGKDPKVTLCHATGSTSNPYVRITVAAAGAYNGHYTQHEDLGRGDIIPPFTYQGSTYSLNWTTDGQSFFAGGCQTPTEPHVPGQPETPGTPGDTAHPGDSGTPGASLHAGTPGSDGREPATAARNGTSEGAGSATASRASDVGPIPGAADAGEGMADTWQLTVGLALASMGALAGGTALYRRRLAGN